MTRNALAAFLAILALATVAHAAPALGGPWRSGLTGLVLRGPTQPVCREGEPCEAPAANLVLIFSRARSLPVRARTDASGRYRVLLAPGTYAVTTSARGPGRGVEPSIVLVRSGRVRHVDLHVDTGIR